MASEHTSSERTASEQADLERKRRALELLDQLFDLDAAARTARLRAIRATDVELAECVERLLSADESPDGRLEEDASALWIAAGQMDENDPMLDRQIGPWRIIERIGHGGMGAVYRAERSDGQFEQTCALKLIRLGLDGPEARRHFLRERQILARLRHEHIATLLDGGISEQQQPWFAMEFVDGQRIDHWCDARCLPVRDRVHLFLQVLDAVRYAHGQLIVHRDLKPSNILVTGDGRVKLLDFGVAKLVEMDGDDPSQTREYALTPEYAAPEQILGQPVSAAADQYTLGVLLHMLLVGTHPLGGSTTGIASLAQRLALLDRQPESLDSAAGRLSPAPARARRSSPRSLARQLGGDLSAIVQRCLESDPARRYASTDALIQDLGRWLDGRAVTARSGRLLYRTRRFLRRNRWAAAGFVLFVALITGFSWNRQLQLERVRVERENTEAVLGFLTESMRQAERAGAGNADITLSELTDLNMKRLDEARSLAPEIRGQLLATIGENYILLGQHEKAREALEQALASLDTGTRYKTQSLFLLGANHYISGDHPAATRYIDRALSASGHLPPGPERITRHIKILALWTALHGTAGDLDRQRVSTELADAATLLEDQRDAIESQEYARALTRLAQSYMIISDTRHARTLLRRAVDTHHASGVTDTAEVWFSQSLMAELLLNDGDLRDSYEEYRSIFEAIGRMEAPNAQSVAAIQVPYAEVLDLLGRTAESIEQSEQALSVLTETGGKDGPDALQLSVSLAERLQRIGQIERAAAMATTLYSDLQGRNEDWARVAHARLLALQANTRLLQGSTQDAAELIDSGRRSIRDLDASRPPVAQATQKLADAEANRCLLSDDLACAERNAREAMDIANRLPGAVRDRLLAQRTLALSLMAQPGREREGRRLLEEARTASLSEFGECNAITLAMRRGLPRINIAALHAPPPPHCQEM